MNILHVGYLDPYTNHGGVERYIFNLVSSFHKKYQLKSDIICAASEYGRKARDYGDVISLKVPFKNIPGSYPVSKYLYSIKIKKYLEKETKEYDVLHFHGDNGSISKGLGTKSVLTLHGIARDDSSIWKRIYSAPLSHIEKNNVRNAAKIFSMTLEAREFFKKYTINDIKLIKQSIDTDFYQPVNYEEKIAIRKSLGIPLDRIVGVITGRDPVRKGLNIAVKALELLRKENILLIAIGFPQNYVTNERVKFTGNIDEFTKLRFLQSADFFIFPSAKEGFPISVLEAAAVGLPLIVSKYSYANELKECVPYFNEVDSLEPEKYSEALNEYIEYYHQTRGRYLKPQVDCISEYSISNTAGIYFKAYSEVMSTL